MSAPLRACQRTLKSAALTSVAVPRGAPCSVCQYRSASTTTTQNKSKSAGQLLSNVELKHTIDSTAADFQRKPLLYSWFSQSYIDKLRAYFGYTSYNNSNQLLDMASTHSRRTEFYNAQTYALPADYGGYMSLLTIHVWLCNVRLRTVTVTENGADVAYNDTKRGKKHIAALWDLYWDRVEGDMVAHNNTYMFRTELKTIQQNVYGACVAFDHSLVSDNKLELIGALYRDIYRSSATLPKTALLYTNEYIVANLNYLLSLSDERFMQLQWQFLDPTQIDISKSPLKRDEIHLPELSKKLVNEQVKRTYN